MPTFLHTGDIHLDSSFSAHFSAERAELRRNEVLRCVSEIVRLAAGVDILLIAGDLFDGSRVSRNTVAYLKRKFAEIPNTRIFIAAGNHDPYTADSVYARENLGDNVYVFGTVPECVEIPELNTRVHGVSFCAGNVGRIEMPRIEKKSGVYDIMLLHADMSGGDMYNPIDRTFIEGCGADYLALGHIHKRTEPSRCGKTWYAYCGIPEGRGFDECGDMGCYLGELTDGMVRVEFVRTCIRRMLRLTADISGAADTRQAADIIRRLMTENGTADDIYRVILTGRVAAGIVSMDIIREELKNSASYAEFRDETRRTYNYKALSEEDSLCGEFIRMLNRMTEEGSVDTEISAMAMDMGIEALLGGDA